MVKIIAEIGSCHGGNLKLAKEAIHVASEVGAWAIKFQLFPNETRFTKNGNIYLPREWWPELAEKAKSKKIEIFASVWDSEAIKILADNGSRYVKYSHGVLHSGIFFNPNNLGLIPILSLDYMDIEDIKFTCINNSQINLFCIPQYPVIFKIHFDGIFDKFDGFSDHTLGISQSLTATDYMIGQKYLEKHFKLKESPDCPDSKFAVTPKDLNKIYDQGWRFFRPTLMGS